MHTPVKHRHMKVLYSFDILLLIACSFVLSQKKKCALKECKAEMKLSVNGKLMRANTSINGQ